LDRDCSCVDGRVHWRRDVELAVSALSLSLAMLCEPRTCRRSHFRRRLAADLWLSRILTRHEIE